MNQKPLTEQEVERTHPHTAELVSRAELGIVIQQIKENAQQMQNLRGEVTSAIRELSTLITTSYDKMNDRIEQTRQMSVPDMSRMAKWAVLVLSLVSMGASVFVYVITMRTNAIEQMASEKARAIEVQASEWRQANRERISRLETWHDDMLRADIEELRQLRKEARGQGQ